MHGLPVGHPLKDTTVQLDSFHTLMNLLCATRTLMEGTGIDTLLEEIYCENAVIHMLNRGHLLVDKCLRKDLGYIYFCRKVQRI